MIFPMTLLLLIATTIMMTIDQYGLLQYYRRSHFIIDAQFSRIRILQGIWLCFNYNTYLSLYFSYLSTDIGAVG